MRPTSAFGVALSLLLVSALPLAGQGSSPSPSIDPPASPTTEEVSMRISSTAFEHEDDIPTQYTCDGADVSPPLLLEEVPADAVTLVLVMDDPDAPMGTWDHWVVYDIPPLAEIPEAVEALGTPGSNSWERTGYGGPCPPSGTHRYFFKVFALDVELGWEAGVDKTSVIEAIHDHVLDEATLLGFYGRE